MATRELAISSLSTCKVPAAVVPALLSQLDPIRLGTLGLNTSILQVPARHPIDDIGKETVSRLRWLLGLPGLQAQRRPAQPAPRSPPSAPSRGGSSTAPEAAATDAGACGSCLT